MASPFELGTSGTGECGTPRVIGGCNGDYGPVKMGVRQDNARGRVYSITYRVQVDPTVHGPLAALWAEGLPAIGSVYKDPNGVADNWAWFSAERDVEQEPREKEGGNQFYLVTCHATSRPGQECTNWLVDDPFSVPDRIRVEAVNYQKEAFEDMNGKPLLNSAFEQFRGKEIEYDAHRFRIVIEGNRTTSGITSLTNYMNHVNDMTMWGQAPRTVKLSHFESEPRYYQDCTKYWVQKLTFDVASDFDRCIVDEGTKCLIGGWDHNQSSPTYGRYVIATKSPTSNAIRDPTNSSDMARYKDWNGQNVRIILDGNGAPYDSAAYTGFINNTTGNGVHPIVITTATAGGVTTPHGLCNGMVVNIAGVTGNTAANSSGWIITNCTTTTFTILATGNGAYAGGGTWTRVQTQGSFCFQVYPEANLFDLDVPTTIDPSP